MGLISRVSSRTYRNKMKYVAAYLLAAQSGSAPSKDAVTKILESIGADIESDKLDKVFAELDGKNVEEVIAEGMSLLASVPSGGAAPAGAGGDAAPAEEAKKESSEEEESDSDMGFDLFG